MLPLHRLNKGLGVFLTLQAFAFFSQLLLQRIFVGSPLSRMVSDDEPEKPPRAKAPSSRLGALGPGLRVINLAMGVVSRPTVPGFLKSW